VLPVLFSSIGIHVRNTDSASRFSTKDTQNELKCNKLRTLLWKSRITFFVIYSENFLHSAQNTLGERLEGSASGQMISRCLSGIVPGLDVASPGLRAQCCLS
jgi:hypothetical protein